MSKTDRLFKRSRENFTGKNIVFSSVAEKTLRIILKR